MAYVEELLSSGAITTGDLVETVRSQQFEIDKLRRIGESGVLGGQPFYLGYNAAPAGTVDFVGVAVHELGHGLGFLSLVRVGSALFGPRPSHSEDT